MKPTPLFSLFILAGMISCSQDFQVYTDEFTTQPVVYCLIDPVDSIHYIRVERIFSAIQPPDESAQESDSLYFSSIEVVVHLTKADGEVKEIFPEEVEESTTISGFFNCSHRRFYRFQEELDWWYYPLYKSIEVEVHVPGLPVAKGSSEFLPRAHVRWPYIAQQYLYVDEERPILVQWHGNAWNEMDIEFNIIEQYEDSLAVQTLLFSKTTAILMLEDVCEVKIPYDLLVQDLLKTLTLKRNLIRRYFGPVRIHIHSGNKDFLNYMKTKDGINDFNAKSATNIENGLGFVACKWTTLRDSLRLDYFSRIRLAADPKLEKFGFIEY